MNQYAHRMVYEECFGPLQPGEQVLHHCDRPPCVQPLHLHLGDVDLNMSEMAQRGRARNAKKTTCYKGHPFDRMQSGRRICSTCDKERKARWRQKQTKKRSLEQLPR